MTWLFLLWFLHHALPLKTGSDWRGPSFSNVVGGVKMWHLGTQSVFSFPVLSALYRFQFCQERHWKITFSDGDLIIRHLSLSPWTSYRARRGFRRMGWGAVDNCSVSSSRESIMCFIFCCLGCQWCMKWNLPKWLRWSTKVPSICDRPLSSRDTCVLFVVE